MRFIFRVAQNTTTVDSRLRAFETYTFEASPGIPQTAIVEYSPGFVDLLLDLIELVNIGLLGILRVKKHLLFTEVLHRLEVVSRHEFIAAHFNYNYLFKLKCIRLSCQL
jgi:hypothetical protein